MMDFQIDQLHTLTAVVDEGTFDAAALRLQVTASAVSQRIKALEQAAGQVLVQRTIPVRLTAAGDVVLRYARQMQLLQEDTAAALQQSSRDGGRILVPLAVNADSLATWFLDALAALPDSTDVGFDIYREDQEHTTALLRSGAVMGAVTSTSQVVQGCTSEQLGIMRYRAVCSPRFVDRRLGGLADVHRLGTAPMVNFDRKDELQRVFLRQVTGQDPRSPRHYVPTSADFARAIVLGLGWGLLPEQQCRTEIASGLLIELAPYDPVDVRLYWQRWNIPSPLLNDISAAIRDAAARSLLAV
jgi:LysR family transcriptional regulator (chromosome initiation inhibitor)